MAQRKCNKKDKVWKDKDMVRLMEANLGITKPCYAKYDDEFQMEVCPHGPKTAEKHELDGTVPAPVDEPADA